MSEGNYFGILPAPVRYDKTIMPMAKILFTEITALSNAKGYCWAQNSVFADLYGVSERQVSAWISALVHAGYVRRELVYQENTKVIKERRLYPSDQAVVIPQKTEKTESAEEEFASPSKETSTGSEENFSTPIEEKFTTPMKKTSTGSEENFSTPPEEKFRENNKFSVINKNLNDVDVVNYLYEKNNDFIYDNTVINKFRFFLLSKNLEYKKYIDFVYDYTLKQKKVKNLRNYFLIIFFEPSMLEIYKKNQDFKKIACKKSSYTCPACGTEYITLNTDICPCCYLPTGTTDSGQIKLHTFISTLSADDKQKYFEQRAEETFQKLRAIGGGR